MNIADAFERKSTVRLVVVQTENVEHVESGADGSKVKKDFAAQEDLTSEIVELDDYSYVVRFRRV